MTSKITAISLFSGAGGMDLGFEHNGVNIVFANELLKDVAETYCVNRPNSKAMFSGDITNILNGYFPFYGVDLVFGGPPCQGFSVAGKMNPEDKRSELIFTFLEVVQRVQPKAFIMENVKALATLCKWQEVKDRYLSIAYSLGYICVPFVVNASDFGVPQKRERVFFIGVKNSFADVFFEYRMGELISSQKSKAPAVRTVLFPLGKAGTNLNPNTCTAKITFASRPIMRKSPYAGMYFNGQGRPINVDEYANTLPASMGGNKTPFVDEEYLYGNAESDWVVDYHKGLLDGSITPEFKEAPSRLRRITIKEAAKLQTFPDDYIFCGTKGAIYMQIGNAVPYKLSEVIARAVIYYLKEQSAL